MTDGRVALILDIAGLVNLANREHLYQQQSQGQAADAPVSVANETNAVSAASETNAQ